MAYDLLIKNGTIVDGCGLPPRVADVAVAAGKIVEIAKIGDGGRRVINVADRVVAPGFVDPPTSRSSTPRRSARRTTASGATTCGAKRMVMRSRSAQFTSPRLRGEAGIRPYERIPGEGSASAGTGNFCAM